MTVRADRRLRLACVVNAPIVVAALTTGGLSGDLFQLFAADVAGLGPSAVGAVYVLLLPVSFLQLLVAPRLVRADSLDLVRRAFVFCALGTALILLGGLSTHPAPAMVLLTLGALVTELAFSLGWVPGWWPLLGRACGGNRKAVATVRVVTQLATAALLLGIGLFVGERMSRFEGSALLLAVTTYFLASAVVVRSLDPGPGPGPVGPPEDEVAPGLREALGRPSEDVAYLLRTYVGPAIVASPFLMALLFLVRFGAGVGVIAALLAATRVASLVGAYLCGVERLSVRGSTLASLWGCAVGSVVLAAAVVVGPGLVGVAVAAVVGLACAGSVLTGIGTAKASQLSATDAPHFFVLEDVTVSVSGQVGAGITGVLLSQSAWTAVGYSGLLLCGAAWCARMALSLPPAREPSDSLSLI